MTKSEIKNILLTALIAVCFAVIGYWFKSSISDQRAQVTAVYSEKRDGRIAEFTIKNASINSIANQELTLNCNFTSCFGTHSIGGWIRMNYGGHLIIDRLLTDERQITGRLSLAPGETLRIFVVLKNSNETVLVSISKNTTSRQNISTLKTSSPQGFFLFYYHETLFIGALLSALVVLGALYILLSRRNKSES